MTNSDEIRRKYKGSQRITSDGIIDPNGYKYPKSMIACYECLFKYADRCAPWAERGLDDAKMRLKQFEVFQEHNCAYILFEPDDDEKVKTEIKMLNNMLFGSRRELSNSKFASPTKSSRIYKYLFFGLAILFVYIVFK